MSEVVKDRSKSTLRWFILFFSCLMMIGNYYCYDIPAALHTSMNEYMGKPDNFETMFSLLYTVYSIPNIILPFFGGYFVDKWGVRVCLLVFASCITLGQLVFAFGLSIKSWPVMLLGRVLYGFGGESLGVGNSAVLSIWFKGKELAFAFGLNLSVARLGSVINNLVSPAIASGVDIQFALWFGVILCGGSILSVMAINVIDKKLELEIASGHKSFSALLGDHNEEVEVDLTGSAASSNNRNVSVDKSGVAHRAISTEQVTSVLAEPKAAEEIRFRDMFTFKQVFWILSIICVVVYGCVLPFNNVASALLLERDYFKAVPSGCQLQNPYECQSASNVPVGCPASTYYQPPLPYNATVGGKIYSPLSSSDIDCTESVWSSGCGKVYCDRQSDAEAQAGTIMSIPYIISACLSPVLGGFVDRYGLRAVIATVAPAALVVVHLLMGFTEVSPVGPLVGQGLAYSGFAAVVWPSVAMVVDERLVGLAYGIVVSIQNMGLASFPLIIAAIYEEGGQQYIPDVEVFFVVLGWLGVMIGLYLNYYDYMFIDSVLNVPRKPELLPSSSRSGSVASGRGSISATNPLLNPAAGDDEEKVKVFAHGSEQ